MRMNAQSLLWLFRRPIGHKAQDIGKFFNTQFVTLTFDSIIIKKKGIWLSIGRFINIMGIIVNGLIIAFASNWAKTVLGNSTNRLIFFVVFEVKFKQILSILINFKLC